MDFSLVPDPACLHFIHYECGAPISGAALIICVGEDATISSNLKKITAAKSSNRQGEHHVNNLASRSSYDLARVGAPINLKTSEIHPIVEPAKRWLYSDFSARIMGASPVAYFGLIDARGQY